LNEFDVGGVCEQHLKVQTIIMNGKIILGGLGALAVTLSASAKDVDVSKLPPASSQKGVTYAKDIKPIFDKSCVSCHGAEKQKAKLRLDSLAATLKGSEDGKVIEAGNSAKSVLVHNVAHIGDEDKWMPPPDNKAKIPPLTPEQIGLIRAWVDQGAK
jgi:mono/diheme cytochrome c family protein